MRELTTKLIYIVCFFLDFQLFRTIMQLLDFDWPANILAGWHFQAQENGLMSPHGVCVISAGPARHETKEITGAASF